MRYRLLAAVAATVLTAGLASAQPAAGPTLEVRLRSVNDLVTTFEYVAGLAGKEDAAKQVRELVKVLSADGKGIEGVDPKKPIGAYATLNKEVETSPFVVMLPIADEDRFLKALKDRLDVTPEKAEGGTLKIAVPLINELHLRFANGYLYVSQKPKDLDAKTILAPKAFFAKDDGALASVLVHIDRIPADLRTFVLGQFELGLSEARKKDADRESPAEKKLKAMLFDSILAGAKGLVDDGKELSLKLFADAKTDEIWAEVALGARSGSPTAKNFVALGQRKSLPAGIVASSGAAARGNISIGVTEGAKKEYAAAIDALLAEGLKKVPPDQEELAKGAAAAFAPMLKAGELDAAGALIGPDAKGRYKAIGAFGVTEGKGIEKWLKDLVKAVGPFIGDKVEFTFDTETVGDFALHKIELKEVDAKFEQLFGTKTVWLATSDKTIAFSIESDGAMLKKGLKAKAIAAPVFSGEVAVAKFLPLAQPDLKPDELKALLKDAFGDGDTTGKDTIGLSVEGGDKLTAKIKVKGKAVRLLAGLDLLKGK
ncbi:MAG: hypothetical protein J0I06_00725 [Planctomycetes bacterium]|nr:hypothetical protein [Planctomycetota bacterium]